jgi:Lrp/AsnC family transcriptional regulator, regulator for asnA, asnC and gidA
LVKLTDLDHKLIRRLNRDARLSSAELAREFGFSERTVRHRIQRLITEGILKPVAVVNPLAFGYNLVVDIFCEVEVHKRENVINAIRALPEVSYMAFSTGDQDISFQALFKNTEAMHEFITQRIYAIPGIRRTRTVLVPRIVKDTYQWLPPEEEFNSPG